MGIYDGIRIGRKPIYTEEEIQLLISFMDEEPHQIKRAQALLEEATDKKSCLDTIKINIKKMASVTKEHDTH